MRNLHIHNLALSGTSPLRHAGASTPFTQGHARTPKLLPFALLSAVLLSAAPQQPLVQKTPETVLRNTGKPLQVPFECAEEELQSVGLLCTEEEPCAIFLELSGVASAGKKLFVSGNLHAQSGTLASILLASDDNGATWREPVKRRRGSALEQVEFYDLEHGWTAGENQYPLPRDPFFLVTSDGGQTWRARPITEDGGSGALQRFWFDTATHGEMVVDAGKSAPGGRYLDYESETGGEGWMLRSISDRMPILKKAPPANTQTDLRLQVNSVGTAWMVERRNGEKWDTVASFLVDAASCKLKAPEAKEPPPMPETVTAESEQEKDYVEEIQLGGPAAKTGKPVPVKKKVSKP